jgi:hypothetical protein
MTQINKVFLLLFVHKKKPSFLFSSRLSLDAQRVTHYTAPTATRV